MSGRERLAFGHGGHGPVPSADAAVAAAATLAHEPAPVRLSRPETWDWGWGGLLIFSILLFFRPQDQIPFLGAMHVSDAAALVGLSAMVAINTSRRQPVTRITPELAGVAALGFFILATAYFSIWPGGVISIFTTLFIQVALIFMLMVNTITSPRRVERICWVIVLAFGYISARVIFDYLRGVNLVEGNRAAGPVGGFFSNPNDLALNLAAFLPLAMMYVKRPGPPGRRVLCAVICVLMATALVFTKSRSGQLAAGAMIVVFLLVSRSLTPATLIALVLGGMVVLPLLPASYVQRMKSIFNEELDPTGSREARRLVMEQAIAVFFERPLTGVGAGQFQNYTQIEGEHQWRQTHNAVLQIAAEIGIFGLLSFLFLVMRVFTAAWWTQRQLAWIHRRTRRRRAPPNAGDGLDDHERMFLQTHGAAMVACMTGWLVAAFFASVAFNWTFYYLLGLSVTARDIVRTRAAAYARARELAARGAAAA